MALRKKLVVNKKEQTSFIIAVCLLCFFIIAINIINIYVLANHFILKEVSPEQAVTVKNILAQVTSRMKGRIALLSIVNILVISGIGLFISHKFSGPSFNIYREIRQIMDGDLTARVKLRTGDQLSDIADSVNLMASELEESVSITNEMASALINKIKKDKELYKSLEPECRALTESLEKYKISAPPSET